LTPSDVTGPSSLSEEVENVCDNLDIGAADDWEILPLLNFSSGQLGVVLAVGRHHVPNEYGKRQSLVDMISEKSANGSPVPKSANRLPGAREDARHESAENCARPVEMR